MVLRSDYYVYAYLRPDLSPYYIGKGVGNRYLSTNRRVAKPKDLNLIVKLATNLTEDTAFMLERFWIKVFGRIDNGTGVLRNMTDGGEGRAGSIGHKWTEEEKQRISARRKGQLLPKHTEETKQKRVKSRQSNGYLSHSDETKAKISNGQRLRHMNNPMTEETRRKKSEAMKKYHAERKGK